ADPDVVAPPAFVHRAHAQGRLVPTVLDHALGARRILRPELDLAVGARTGAMRDAHDVTGRPAVQEEAFDGARQVAVVGVPVDVEELVPAAEQRRLVHRTARGEPHETGHPRVRHGERLGARLVGGGVYAGWPNLSHRSHGLVTLLALLPGFVDLAIDPRYLTQPDVSFVVLHSQDVVERPMEVVRDIGYLLVNLLQGVARYPPAPAAPPPPRRSTSNSVWHEGHLAWTLGAPSSLMRR